MKPVDLEARMRKGEYFHSIRVPDGMWFVVRLDGRGFTKMTKEMELQKPFDDELRFYMTKITQALMKEFQGVFATTHSDEISIVFPSTADFFDREVEKIVSTTAATASALFTMFLQIRLATFDSRIWIGASIEDVCDYFSWRMDDAARGAINSYAYWMARQRDGMSQRQATRLLEGKNFAWKNEYLFSKYGINFNNVPAWQRRGTGFYWKMVDREGFNPVKQEKVLAKRRILHQEEELPMKEDFREFLSSNLAMLCAIPNLRGSFMETVEQWKN